jgi:outer membrane immunogenic protein
MGDENMRLKLIGTGIAAMALLATSFSAEAADIPRPVYKGMRSVVAYYNWTGLYVGVNAGYGWGRSSWDLPAVTVNSKGWLAGITLGYNYQVGSWVFGIEGDYDWADVKGTAPCFVAATCEIKNSYLATIRGRLGYAYDRWLPYLTAGGAYGDVRATINPVGLTASKALFGWTIGGGLEYAFMGNWTAKLEYLYVDLGSFDTGFAAPVAADNVSFREHVVRAGLNYKFSGPIFSRW